MDYSGASGQGSSPWASSPEASRTSFGDDVPSRPLPGPAMGDEHEDGANGAQGGYGGAGSWSPEQRQQWRQDQQQDEQQHDQQQYQQQQSYEENRRPPSARYVQPPPQHQQAARQQHHPQYKLQAKITGLERAGKKDPILRFDVYVCPKANLIGVSAGAC